MPTILIIDDEQNILVTLSRALQVEGYQTEVAGSGRLGQEKAASHPIDLVLLDVKLPDIDGLEVLEKLRQNHPDLPVIMMSGHATVEIAVRAVQLGAKDFIEKPLSSEKILVTIQNCLTLSRLAAENRDLKALIGLQHQMVGQSAQIQAVYDQVELVAPSNSRVLITGENGTGKELVARSIHSKSLRRNGPFIKLNCAAIPQELIESELFGHEKGSFTGASAQRRGKFETAHGGTLFLDEVGDMTLSMQAKLLRVLQEGEIERVGSSATLQVDVRVLSATNQKLERAIAAGRFREDLYYRLKVIPIHLPPLRERPTDIPLLAEHFLKLACQENNRRPKTFAQEALERLRKHSWPGNVRELKNSIERLLLMAAGEEIMAADVGRLFGEDARGNTVAFDGPSLDGLYQPDLNLRDLLSLAEKAFIERALRDCEGHISNTAKQLGLERSSFYKKMKMHGIK